MRMPRSFPLENYRSPFRSGERSKDNYWIWSVAFRGVSLEDGPAKIL